LGELGYGVEVHQVGEVWRESEAVSGDGKISAT